MTDSPVHSSSTQNLDDFAAYLEDELEVMSTSAENEENQDDVDSATVRMTDSPVHSSCSENAALDANTPSDKNESMEETEVSTNSEGLKEQSSGNDTDELMDFAAYLEDELLDVEAKLPSAEDNKNQEDVGSVRRKDESMQETEVATSKGLDEQSLVDFVAYLEDELEVEAKSPSAEDNKNQDDVDSATARMSLETESLLHSSSIDDFCKYLEATLTVENQSAENQDAVESARIKRLKVESIKETEVSTSEGLRDQNLETILQTIEAALDANSSSDKDEKNQNDVEGARMILETDSPSHSSSLDEFINSLEATIVANTPPAEDDANQSAGLKVESIKEIEVSTSEGPLEENLGSKDTQTIEATLDANLPSNKDNENQEDVEGARMSIDDTDSPLHSSSIEEFSKYLEDTLTVENTPSAEGDENQDDIESARLKVESIEETEVSTSEGLVEQSLVDAEASLKVDVCRHPGSFGDMCIHCGQKMDGKSGVSFDYICRGLKLHDQEISRLRITDMKSLLRHKKLNLVLDLDHTLLNTTQLLDLYPDEGHLSIQADSLEDVSKGSLFKMERKWFSMTKLRPFVRTFLKEASKMFEMYIYTMGDQFYALEMANLLDPEGEYFNSKVISRDDVTEKHQKGLDVLLGQESAILILDDTENAWLKHTDNLILMERYLFFAKSCQQFCLNCKSLAELRIDENESDGALARILKVLKRVHHIFFNELEEDVDRDVRQILKTLRSEVLSGCVLVFSRIVPTALPGLQKMAEQMGAICLTEIDPSITHVVATDVGTEKSLWALKEHKFLVNPRWIEAANYFWQKQPEEEFPLNRNQQ